MTQDDLSDIRGRLPGYRKLAGLARAHADVEALVVEVERCWAVIDGMRGAVLAARPEKVAGTAMTGSGA